MLESSGVQLGKAALCWPGEDLVCQAEQLGLDAVGNSQPLVILEQSNNVLCKSGRCFQEHLPWAQFVAVELPASFLEVTDATCYSDTGSDFASVKW